MPQGHLPPKTGGGADLSFVYEETAPLFTAKKYGRPAIDPVVNVKYLLVGFLYGIPSERQIERRSRPTSPCAGTWADLRDRVPDHCSTISYRLRNRPSARCFGDYLKKLWAVRRKRVFVSGRVIGTDSTHVRAANASRASEELVEVAEESAGERLTTLGGRVGGT